MSKHTPEPWFDDRATHDEPYQNIKILGDENRGICWLWIDDAPVDDWNAEQRANANRIVTCVNACAGMADPATEIAELKRQRDRLQLEAINCHEMLCSEIERTTNLIAELGFVSEYATKSVIGFCKGDEKSIFEFSKFMEGIFNRYDFELSNECEDLINEGKFTKRENSLN